MKSIDNLRKWSHRFDYTWIKLDGTMIFATDSDYKCDDGENYGQLIRSMIDDIEYEIVHCYDCKHYTDDDMEYYHYCGNWCEQVEPSGFCSWGQRR